jgi:single-strand DNA-binding protein
MGRLTRDPELRYTPKNTPVLDIGLAVNRTWTDEQGGKREDTTFVDVILWNRLAEVAQQ